MDVAAEVVDTPMDVVGATLVGAAVVLGAAVVDGAAVVLGAAVVDDAGALVDVRAAVVVVAAARGTKRVTVESRLAMVPASGSWSATWSAAPGESRSVT